MVDFFETTNPATGQDIIESVLKTHKEQIAEIGSLIIVDGYKTKQFKDPATQHIPEITFKVAEAIISGYANSHTATIDKFSFEELFNFLKNKNLNLVLGINFKNTTTKEDICNQKIEVDFKIANKIIEAVQMIEDFCRVRPDFNDKIYLEFKDKNKDDRSIYIKNVLFSKCLKVCSTKKGFDTKKLKELKETKLFKDNVKIIIEEPKLRKGFFVDNNNRILN